MGGRRARLTACSPFSTIAMLFASDGQGVVGIPLVWCVRGGGEGGGPSVVPACVSVRVDGRARTA